MGILHMKKLINAVIELILISAVITTANIYKYYGEFKNIDLVNDYCMDAGCSVVAPNEFHEGKVSLSLLDTSMNAFYETMRNVFDANGWKMSKRKNKIFITADTVLIKTYLDAMGNVRNVPVNELKYWLQKDSVTVSEMNRKKDSLMTLDSINRIKRKIDEVQIVYTIVSDSYIRNNGTSWGKPLLEGNPKPSYLMNWMLHLDEQKDSLYDHRVINVNMDTSATVSWGQIVTRNVVNETDKQTITTTQDERYGFTIKISEGFDSTIFLTWDYFAPPPSDYSSGTVVGRGLVCASGGIDIYKNMIQGIPWISNIPGVGWLFKWESRQLTKSQLYICARYLTEEDRELKIPRWQKKREL